MQISLSPINQLNDEMHYCKKFDYLKRLSQKMKDNNNTNSFMNSSVEELNLQINSKGDKITNTLSNSKKKIVNKIKEKEINVPQTFGKLSDKPKDKIENNLKEQIDFYKNKLRDKDDKINSLFKRIQEVCPIYSSNRPNISCGHRKGIGD